MSLVGRLQERLKQALKAGRKDEVSSLRLVISELQRVAKDTGRELSEDEEIAILRKEQKKRLEAAEAYRGGGRPESRAKEEAEAALIAEFLPEQLDEGALRKLVEEAIAETAASSPKDMGKVMGVVMERGGSRVDGRTASRLVKERLSQ